MCEEARGDEMKQLRAEQEKSKRRCLNFENQVQDTKVGGRLSLLPVIWCVRVASETKIMIMKKCPISLTFQQIDSRE